MTTIPVPVIFYLQNIHKIYLLFFCTANNGKIFAFHG